MHFQQSDPSVIPHANGTVRWPIRPKSNDSMFEMRSSHPPSEICYSFIHNVLYDIESIYDEGARSKCPLSEGENRPKNTCDPSRPLSSLDYRVGRKTMKFQKCFPQLLQKRSHRADRFYGNSGDGCQSLHLYEGRFSSSERILSGESIASNSAEVCVCQTILGPTRLRRTL